MFDDKKTHKRVLIVLGVLNVLAFFIYLYLKGA